MKETRVLMILLLVTVIAAHFPVHFKVQKKIHPKSAVCNLIPSTGSTVSGQVQLSQASNDVPVQITFSIQGLTPPGLHGFHLHRDGNTDDDCKAAGPHFNPFNHTHGGPEDEIRHAGDFGNILAEENGNASDQIQGTLISLCPESECYAVGRAFVVHAGTDDLGKGGNEESLKTGNAGGRLACCVVEAVNN
jgi:Cu-Zn family superoxide dismutase